MDELTIEQKAKAYDEVVNKLKGFMAQGVDPLITRADVQDFFPELKESEDERIRTFLYHTFAAQYLAKDKLGKWHGEPVVNILAWLEKQGQTFTKKDVDDAYLKGVCDTKHELDKQGEQKEYTFKSLPRLLDMIEPTSKAKAYCQKLIDALVKEGYTTDAKIVGECLKAMNGENVPMAIMDEKQGEQKPTNLAKGEDYGIDGLYNAIRILEKTLGKVDGYQTDDGILEHECAISAVKKLYEQKPAWSEEDNFMYNKIKNLLTDISLAPESRNGLFDWLEDIKDRVQHRPKQEWSEEDKKLINDTCHLINTLASGYGEKVTEPITFSGTQMIASIKDRLSALVDNRPQNTWKPSKKMLEALYRAIPENVMEISEDEMLLNKLYQGLKYGKVLSEK